MAFESAEQFDRAAKKSIRKSGRNAGIAYREMLRDRFLCRVFADPGERFVLKGGSGMLARIPDARATKDIDFATRTRETAESALMTLNGLVAKDLGDYCSFALTDWSESIDENGYSRLLRLRYASYIGDEEKDPVLIDLSLDCSTTLPPERVTPANRVAIEGAQTCDYLTYSLPDQLADKLCAIMETHASGWPSSRMKDLVDVISYATHETFSLGELTRAIAAECSKRDMEIPEHFAAPPTWKKRFRSYALKNGTPEQFAGFESASTLASRFYDPALAGTKHDEARWNPDALSWEPV